MNQEIRCDVERTDIEIYGGELYQWDIDRKVIIHNEEANEVHFAHKGSCKTAIVVLVKDEDDQRFADIPNSLLTSPRDICAWTCKEDQTLSGLFRLHVHDRPRPDSYIYKPTDVLTLESVVQWVKDYIEDFTLQNATNYESLENKPSIEGVELVGDKKMTDFGVVPIPLNKIDALFSKE